MVFQVEIFLKVSSPKFYMIWHYLWTFKVQYYVRNRWIQFMKVILMFSFSLFIGLPYDILYKIFIEIVFLQVKFTAV
jgi:hypothetical protein